MSVVQALFAAYGGGATGLIKSIQAVSITLASTVTSNTATVSSFTTGNAFLLWGGYTSDNTTANRDSSNMPTIGITDSTTVSAGRGLATATDALVVNFFVVEFNSGKATVQHTTNTIAAAASSKTSTITSVTTTDTAISYRGNQTDQTTVNFANSRVNAVLTDATTVTFGRNSTTGNCFSSCEVISFGSGVLNSNTQQISITIAASTTSNTAAVSSVTTNKTWFSYGGFQGTSTAFNRLPRITLTSATVATANRTNGTSSTMTINGSIVEFKSADITSINRGTNVIASGSTSQATTITSVNTAKTFVSFLGFSPSTSVTAFSQTVPANTLASSTSVSSDRNTSTTNTVTSSFEAIEFA